MIVFKMNILTRKHASRWSETDETSFGLEGDDKNEQLKRSTIRKLDYVLLPLLCVLFLLNSLDKSNIGNAETAGTCHSRS
jgi:hypothetical protein